MLDIFSSISDLNVFIPSPMIVEIFGFEIIPPISFFRFDMSFPISPVRFVIDFIFSRNSSICDLISDVPPFFDTSSIFSFTSSTLFAIVIIILELFLIELMLSFTVFMTSCVFGLSSIFDIFLSKSSVCLFSFVINFS